jgi:HAE1 family hydrophobic/amphiphilic exporter-1
MFSRFFINRPVFACVISIVIVLLGVVSYFGLPIAQYPELAPPVVRVEALYPGANAKTIADTVAAPLEQEINGVDGMIYMNSVSSDGRYSLDVSFAQGTNVDIAAVLVQNRVNIAEPKLPEEVRRLGITTRKQSTAFVGVVSLSSPNGTQSDITLSNFLSTNWKDEIARIPGVGGISVLPAKDYSIRVWLDPEKLRARGLTVSEVTAAIRAQNVQVAAGAIGRQPAPTGTDFEFIVNTQGRLSDPDQFADIIVKSTSDQRVVRIRDIGRVELGSRDYNTLATFNGRPNAIMIVYQLPGANLVEIASRLKTTVDQLSSPSAAVKLPPDTQAKLFYDSSMFIRASIEEVSATLIEAFILVFIVVLVFLQSFRTTIIPAITIPVSLIGTLLMMKLFGFSINMLTMFGMVLAIGIVVDDAIIVVENVERNMREGNLSPKDATLKAMGEIFAPVVAVTLVLMAVFLPTAALPGISGEMYRQFALTIAASTALSAINALTLSPALCALILKPHNPHHKGFILFRPFRLLANLFNRTFDILTNLYARIVHLGARLAAVTLLLFAGVVALTGILLTRVPTGFVPNEDLGFVVVSIQMPDGSSLERTKHMVDRVSEQIRQVDGVEDVVTLSGFSVIQGQGTSVGNAWIVLKPWDERARSKRSVDTIMGEIRQRVGAFQEGSTLVFSLPAISGLGNTSGFDLRIQDKQSLGLETLQDTADQIVAASFQQPGIAYSFTSFRAGVPQIYLDIDREKVIKLDIPLSTVFETLQTYLGSTYANDFNLGSRTFQVNVQADFQFRLQAEDIRRLEVRNRKGQMIPLGTFVQIQDAVGPERIERYNMYPAATINGGPKPGISSGDSIAIMEKVAADKLPPGMGFEWTALSYQEKQAGGTAVLVFAFGLVLVYLILAAQYESWMTPLAVVLSVPLVIIGAMIALDYRALDNNIFTQIGLVLLIGLGAKNAILIVEFARENRAAGKSRVESAVLAAKTRFRPIIMTSLAFILGVVPLLTATGAGAAGRQSIGTAVFGGMVGATILGLLFTPALYVAVEWFADLFRGRSATPSTPPAPATPSPPAPAPTPAG